MFVSTQSPPGGRMAPGGKPGGGPPGCPGPGIPGAGSPPLASSKSATVTVPAFTLVVTIRFASGNTCSMCVRFCPIPRTQSTFPVSGSYRPMHLAFSAVNQSLPC
ncbi:hypothetical protein DYQ86_19945 [Acidobacteria bacterium AB60]|nr:hypothetical protein DYQ86_19945 [Acidobacteria bacterium AB60]